MITRHNERPKCPSNEEVARKKNTRRFSAFTLFKETKGKMGKP